MRKNVYVEVITDLNNPEEKRYIKLGWKLLFDLVDGKRTIVDYNPYISPEELGNSALTLEDLVNNIDVEYTIVNNN